MTARSWRPTLLARLFLPSARWTLTLVGRELTLEAGGQSTSVSLGRAATAKLEPDQRHARLLVDCEGARLVVNGVPRSLGTSIVAALDKTLDGIRREVASSAEPAAVAENGGASRVGGIANASGGAPPTRAASAEREARARRRARALRVARAILDWYEQVDAELRGSDGSLKWVLATTRERLDRARPERHLTADELDALRGSARALEELGSSDERFEAALRTHDAFDAFVDAHNEAYTAAEVAWFRREIRTEGKYPMTDEQVRAAVCFDGRMLAIASAGSGKTSTMVAKAVYMIRRGLVSRERVLMLAFNKRAAKELRARTRSLLRQNGIVVSWEEMKSRGRTLHSFGFAVVQGVAEAGSDGQPDIGLAPYLANEETTELKVHELIATLRRTDWTFERRWAQLRVLCPMARAYRPPEIKNDPRPEGADGLRYRHPQDVVLADWLFARHVLYHYDENDGFVYPAIGLRHRILRPEDEMSEGDSSDGEFRDLHREAQSADPLLTSTSVELEDGSVFDRLEEAFAAKGIVLEEDDARRSGEEEAFDGDELVAFFLSFIGRAKDVAVGDEELRRRLAALPVGPTAERDRVALELAMTVRHAWDRELAEGGHIDYSDMIGQAVEHLEAGRATPTDDLILVDEFQDMSTSRIRLLNALLERKGSRLFGVGDDWQGINGFAGSDVRAVTEFEREFGRGTVLYLNETFRFPQALANLSRDFVQKNPDQLRKAVRSVSKASTPVIRAHAGAADSDVRDAVVRWLEKHAESVGEPVDKNERRSVMLLGRNRTIKQYLAKSVVKRFAKSLDIECRTIHTSKGAEADYVVVPQMLRGRFPSTRETDPVLQVVMPKPERFALAEERRLFYVALTRARIQVSLLTVSGRESPFLNELVKDGVVEVHPLSVPTPTALASADER